MKAGSADEMHGPLAPVRYKYLKSVWPLYVMLLPGIVYMIIFRYLPMAGLTIAFQKFSIFKGVWRSPFIGMENFRDLFNSVQFFPAFRNTVVLGVMRLVFVTPAPLILALLLNEIRSDPYKKLVQTASYIPYFVSWVVLYGLLSVMINPTDGVIPHILSLFGVEANIDVLSNNQYFRWVLTLTNGYKNVGFNAIIYLAAISSVDPGLYEAATIDGARRFRKCLHITIPCVMPIIAVMLILDVGFILDAGFDQVYMFYNPLVYETGDIIDTFVYRKAISDSNYSMSAAAQMLKSVIGIALITGSNMIVKRIDPESSMW